MSNSLTIRQSASPEQVRIFAAANNLPTGKRGKFTAEVIAAYNKAHPVKYIPGGHVQRAHRYDVKIKGKKTQRTTTPELVRAVLREAGEPVGKRGRITQDQVQRAFDLVNAAS